jgi:hypothetical protein
MENFNMNDNNEKNDQIENGNIKGTVQRDFLPLFFLKLLTLIAVDMSRSNFEFREIFVELFVFEVSKNQLPAVKNSGESKLGHMQPNF